MRFYPNRSVEDQMNRLPVELQNKYQETQLDRIEIDGETITGYFEYSFLEEKSYFEQPTRSSDGSMPELRNAVTFLTPRLIIKYNMMNIDDYRTLMKIIQSKNVFNVTFYDIVKDQRVTREMYFAPPSMPIIYQQYLMALGIQEYTIELIGTNNDAIANVVYDLAIPEESREFFDAETIYSFDYSVGQSVALGSELQDSSGTYIFPTQFYDSNIGRSYYFDGWQTSAGDFYNYGDGNPTVYLSSGVTIITAHWWHEDY